ncbi:hypothetical protein HQ487_00105 [Candidatus Uhrbacteria bacterium]|nr:hypothetical protein [Candidatus Uhrbacteria bacterium]
MIHTPDYFWIHTRLRSVTETIFSGFLRRNQPPDKKESSMKFHPVLLFGIAPTLLGGCTIAILTRLGPIAEALHAACQLPF